LWVTFNLLIFDCIEGLLLTIELYDKGPVVNDWAIIDYELAGTDLAGVGHCYFLTVTFTVFVTLPILICKVYVPGFLSRSDGTVNFPDLVVLIEET